MQIGGRDGNAAMAVHAAGPVRSEGGGRGGGRGGALDEADNGPRPESFAAVRANPNPNPNPNHNHNRPESFAALLVRDFLA